MLVSNLLAPTLRALAFAQATAPATLRAVTGRGRAAPTTRCPREWEERGVPVPLVVIESPYRETVRPVLRYVRQLRREHPGDVISIVIPEYVVGALVAEPAPQPDRAAAEGAAAVRAVGDGDERAVGARRRDGAIERDDRAGHATCAREDLLDEPVAAARARRSRPRPPPAADRALALAVARRCRC